MATKKKSKRSVKAKKVSMSAAAVSEVVTAYKGFTPDWKCRDMQYAVGETYTHEGKVIACKAGLHSCENPMDVFSYYEPGTSVFARVEASGEIARHGDDSKVASAKLKIVAQISLHDMVARGVAWIMSKIDKTKAANEPSSVIENTGDRSAATNTGYSSAATNTGYRSAASVEGKDSVAIATGYASKASASAGSAIVCVYRDANYKLVHIKAGIAGRDGIRPGVFYTLDKGGDFVEAS